VFIPDRSGEIALSIFQNMGDTREERTVLSLLTLDVEAGKEVEIRCALSTSGLMRCVVRHKNTTVEMPLLALKHDVLPEVTLSSSSVFSASRASSAFSSSSASSASVSSVSSVNARRLRELKLQLTSLEILCSPGQVERLHNLVRRVEKIEDNSSSMKILEGIVKDLEIALS
jgi:hypothetical protein